MTQDEWKQMFDTLSEIHSKFRDAYWNYENGKKKRIRDDGLADAYNAIHLACRYIERNTDVMQLLTAQQGSPYGKSIAYDEFKQPNYFGRDLSDLLKKIQMEIGG